MEIYFYKLYEDWEYETLGEQTVYHTTQFSREEWQKMLVEAANYSVSLVECVSTQSMKEYLINTYNFTSVDIHLHGRIDESNRVNGEPEVKLSMYKDVVDIFQIDVKAKVEKSKKAKK